MTPSTVVYIKHALVPQNRVVEEFCGRSIAELDPQWDRPYIAVLDGEAILRKDWGVAVPAGSCLVFVDVLAIPQGGGSSPLRIIAMIAVAVISYFAPYLAPTAWGIQAGSTAASLLSSAVFVGGMALVNAVLPPQLAGGQQSYQGSPSPTYSTQAQGNYARLEGAIPEHFGRHIAYPDYAAQPYQEFYGNDQYLYSLLCIGRGEYSIESIRVEDTEISNFDAQYEVIPPYDSLDLFPANVISSSEVSGFELETGVATLAVVANPEGTQANYIGVDFFAPKGLFGALDDGSLMGMWVSVDVYLRTVDDNGNATSGWWIAQTFYFNAQTVTPQRFSRKFAVSPARYQVKVIRGDYKQTGTRFGHDFMWAGLRAYLPETRIFGDCTLLAIRIKATNQLSSMSSRRINVVATRKLPVWNGSYWSAPQATRSIAAALAYCCKQVGFTDATIDLAGLLALDYVWYGRGDTCDGRIDSFSSFWEALAKIASSGRCKPFMQGGVMRFFRDQAQSIPVSLFSMRNIVKGSFSVEYLMPTTDTADAIDVTYFDETTWKTKRVRAALPDSTASKPTKMDLPFVVKRQQAYQSGMYNAACNRRRRKMIKFKTEQTGFIPAFGDLIAIQHDMPAWGQAGEIVAHDGTLKLLTTSEPLRWETGETHYMAMEKKDGSVYGPFAVTMVDDYTVSYSDTISFIVNTGTTYERTRYAFGWASTWAQKAIVLSIKPAGLYMVEVEAIGDDATVHTADVGVFAPAEQTSQLPVYTAYPVVKGLAITSTPGDIFTAILSWQPAAWAERYIVERSSDGEQWERLGETTSPNYSARATFASNTVFRVAAIGGDQGPWAYINYGPEFFGDPIAQPANLTMSYADGSAVLHWDSVTDERYSPIEYEIRRGSSWESAVVLGFSLLPTFPTIGDGLYWVAARWKPAPDAALYSTPASILVSVSRLAKNVVATWDEQSTGWSGTLADGLVEASGNLTLTSQGDILSESNVLAMDNFLATGAVSPSGSYTIPSGHHINIGRVTPCFVSIDYTVTPESIYSDILSMSDLLAVDDLLSSALGPTISVQPQIAIADESGVFGDWQNFLPGTCNAQYFKARLLVATSSLEVSAVVSAMVFTVDMPDRIDSITVSLPAGGQAIIYDPAFIGGPNNTATPLVQATVIGATAGDDVLITSQATTGCTAQVVNGGSGVARTVNLLIQGY